MDKFSVASNDLSIICLILSHVIIFKLSINIINNPNNINRSLFILEYTFFFNPILLQLVVSLGAISFAKSGYGWSTHFSHAITFLVALNFLLQSQYLIQINVLEAFQIFNSTSELFIHWTHKILRSLEFFKGTMSNLKDLQHCLRGTFDLAFIKQ